MPTSTDLARGQALSRAVFGAALVLAPRRVAAPWIGARSAARPGTAVVTVAMGARDLGLGIGTIRAVQSGQDAKSWLAMAVLADAADLVATVRARRDLPSLGAAGVTLMAGSSTALGLYLRAQLD